MKGTVLCAVLVGLCIGCELPKSEPSAQEAIAAAKLMIGRELAALHVDSIYFPDDSGEYWVTWQSDEKGVMHAIVRGVANLRTSEEDLRLQSWKLDLTYDKEKQVWQSHGMNWSRQ
jgi:hypothetical protein